MEPMTDQERRIAAGALGLLALTLALCGVAASAVAFEHMARDAGICGPLTGHCGWCYGAAGLVVSALIVLASAVRTARMKTMKSVSRPA